jgi:hypothetical protein
MQPPRGMTLNKRTVQKVLQGALAAAPAIPYLTRSRARTSVAAYVLGGLSLALAGGIIAVMYFSPRTRTRALGVAKETYGKVNEKIGQLRGQHGQTYGQTYGQTEGTPMSNGLVDRGDYGATSGL